MSVRDDLIAAKALIDTPEKWLGKESGNWEGTIIGALSDGVSAHQAYEPAKAALVRQMPSSFRCLPTAYEAITAYGDTHDHADIMALFDRAIEAAS